MPKVDAAVSAANDELFVQMHEQLLSEGLTVPNIRKVIQKEPKFSCSIAPDPVHSYRARLCRLRNLPDSHPKAAEFANRLQPFRMNPNNKKDKAMAAAAGVLVEA